MILFNFSLFLPYFLKTPQWYQQYNGGLKPSEILRIIFNREKIFSCHQQPPPPPSSLTQTSDRSASDFWRISSSPKVLFMYGDERLFWAAWNVIFRSDRARGYSAVVSSQTSQGPVTERPTDRTRTFPGKMDPMILVGPLGSNKSTW